MPVRIPDLVEFARRLEEEATSFVRSNWPAQRFRSANLHEALLAPIRYCINAVRETLESAGFDDVDTYRLQFRMCMLDTLNAITRVAAHIDEQMPRIVKEMKRKLKGEETGEEEEEETANRRMPTPQFTARPEVKAREVEAVAVA